MTENENLKGGWFSTSDMKLAVALESAGFRFKPGGECTRLERDGKESFTWHFDTVNGDGQEVAAFLRAWEHPLDEGKPYPDAMTRFLLARETLLLRHNLLTQSHGVPLQKFRQRGENRLLYTPRLKPEDRARLQAMAS